MLHRINSGQGSHQRIHPNQKPSRRRPNNDLIKWQGIMDQSRRMVTQERLLPRHLSQRHFRQQRMDWRIRQAQYRIRSWILTLHFWFPNRWNIRKTIVSLLKKDPLKENIHSHRQIRPTDIWINLLGLHSQHFWASFGSRFCKHQKSRKIRISCSSCSWSQQSYEWRTFVECWRSSHWSWLDDG